MAYMKRLKGDRNFQIYVILTFIISCIFIYMIPFDCHSWYCEYSHHSSFSNESIEKICVCDRIYEVENNLTTFYQSHNITILKRNQDPREGADSFVLSLGEK